MDAPKFTKGKDEGPFRKASFMIWQHLRKRRAILFVVAVCVTVAMLVQLDIPTSASTIWRQAGSHGKSTEPIAINLLETTFYEHHPIMRMVPQDVVKFDKDFLIEVNDLHIPADFDCENLDNKATWGGFSYFKSNPARWHACWLHFASLRTGLPGVVPPLPLIDEEYFEHVSVYDSVLRAKGKYTMVELGARWGTWGARAVAFLKKVKPMPYDVLFVEPSPVHCKGLRQVMEKNDIHYNLLCDYAKPADFVNWASNQTHINLLDLDIQGAETQFFADKGVMRTVEDKVHRIILGTHTDEIHAAMRKKFSHWVLVQEMPMNLKLDCIKKYLRTPPQPDRSNFEALVNLNCYHQSSFGKIPNYDGELILDNPKFFDGNVLFPKADYSIKEKYPDY